MRACVIGGTGHIGSYLIPMLVETGMEISVVARGRTDIPGHQSWETVELLEADYIRRNEEWHTFIRRLKADVVIDLLGHDLPGVYHEIRNFATHLIACGSFWMYGPPQRIPTPEEAQNPCEFETYARRYRDILGIQGQAAHDSVSFTAIMPSNICGPGKIPIDVKGGRDAKVHRALAAGEPVVIPRGCNTLIAPCDVADVARGFFLAVTNRDAAAGEIFNVGPPYALTVEKFIQTYETIYRRNISIEYMDWVPFLKEYLSEPGANYHFREHMSPDIAKIRSKLGYEPQFTPEESMNRAVQWMYEEGILN